MELIMIATEMMLKLGVPACVVEGRLLNSGWRRGRPSKDNECPDLKMKPNLSRWLPESVAMNMLEVTHEKIVLMIGKGELHPAIHRGRLFISVDSIKKKKERDRERPNPKTLIDEESSPELPQTTRFMPIIKMTDKTTPSKVWTKPKFQVKTNQFQSSALAIKLTEYAPGQFGYHIEDVATAMNKVVAVPLHLISGRKVEADPTGLYITQQSLKDFFRRSRGIEIQDI
jgi:hypothetical protein